MASSVHHSASLSAIRVQTSEPDPLKAVATLRQVLARPGLAGVLFFASGQYDTEVLGLALSACFSCPVLGCTTAGELGPSGYTTGGISAVGLIGDVRIQPLFVPDVDVLDGSSAARLVGSAAPAPEGFSRFGLLLVDGLSLAEERVCSLLKGALAQVPLVGGSAGDDQAFEATWVYYDGRFHGRAAVLALVDTAVPFKTFRVQHVRPTARRMVITAADSARRKVTEIDGRAAADTYASMVGVQRKHLGPEVFSRHPVVLKVGDQHYVRSIREVGRDGSLTFYCAIEEGLVLTLAESHDLLGNLKESLDALVSEIPKPALILTCDCILRRQELEARGLVHEANRLLANYPVLGFSTYGEQIEGLHVNQTLTGIALGGCR